MLEINFIDFPSPDEFNDRFGQTRSIPTCSPLGRVEFWLRINEIKKRLEESSSQESWHRLFDRSERFRFLVIRCIQLNGIDPEYLTMAHVEDFLFYRYDVEKEEYIPGRLLELNCRKEDDENDQLVKRGEELTIEEVVALISLVNNQTIGEAIIEASQIPARVLMPIVEAKQALQDPEFSTKKKQKTMRKKLEGPEFDRLMKIPVNQLKQVKRI